MSFVLFFVCVLFFWVLSFVAKAVCFGSWLQRGNGVNFSVQVTSPQQEVSTHYPFVANHCCWGSVSATELLARMPVKREKPTVEREAAAAAAARTASAASLSSAVNEVVAAVHLDWSSKQGRILTFAGRAEEFYKADMFAEEELPHYELDHGTAQRSFLHWQEEAARGKALSARGAGIVGCWSRPLFLGRGGFENTTDATEEVFNMQAPGLFIDLRIPVQRAQLVDPSRTAAGPADLSDSEIRYLARQHVFGGFSRIIVEGVAGASTKATADAADDAQCVCVRHHFIDWNYIGHPRTRPNKWSIEHPPQRRSAAAGTGSNPGDIVERGTVWMEHSFAPHPRTGQPYYSERWARRTHDAQGDGRVVSLLSRNPASKGACGRGGAKAIVIVIGQRFSYLVQPSDRGLSKGAGEAGLGPDAPAHHRVFTHSFACYHQRVCLPLAFCCCFHNFCSVWYLAGRSILARRC